MPSSPVVAQRSPARRHAWRGARLVPALALGAAWLAFWAFTIAYLGAALVELWVRAIVLLPRAAVWLFVAVREGLDWWSIVGQAGTALAELLVAPQPLSWLIGLEAIGAAALYGLHRLFRTEVGESRRGTDSPEVKR